MTISSMPVREWRRVWTEIAVANETEPDDRTELQHDLVGASGLCVAFDEGTEWKYKGDREFSAICYLMQSFAQTTDVRSEWYPLGGWEYNKWHGIPPSEGWTRKYDLLRSTHAAFFAAMTPKEFLRICGGNEKQYSGSIAAWNTRTPDLSAIRDALLRAKVACSKGKPDPDMIYAHITCALSLLEAK